LPAFDIEGLTGQIGPADFSIHRSTSRCSVGGGPRGRSHRAASVGSHSCDEARKRRKLLLDEAARGPPWYRQGHPPPPRPPKPTHRPRRIAGTPTHGYRDARDRDGRLRQERAEGVINLGCSRSANYFDNAFSCVHLQGEILSCG
jgi:hypothetical protein